MKTRLLTSNLSYPIGSFPSQIHLSCPSVQHENLPDGHPLELPEIGNFNGSLVLEAFTITSKNVDLWRLPNRRTPVTGKWSSLFFSIRIRRLILFEIINTCRTTGERGVNSPDNCICMPQSIHRNNLLTKMSAETSGTIKKRRKRK